MMGKLLDVVAGSNYCKLTEIRDQHRLDLISYKSYKIMKNRKTYYLLILDKSGSMYPIVDDTIGGFNKQINTLKNLHKKFNKQELFVSLCTFNTKVDDNIDRVSIEEVNNLDENSYVPIGGTSLLDAMGYSINKLKNTIENELKKEEASVVVVIMTDGQENSSRMYSHLEIKNMISALEETGQWSFTYLGARFDAFEIARSMNFRTSSSLGFEKENIAEAFCSIDKQMVQYMAKKEKGLKNIKLFNEDTPDNK